MLSAVVIGRPITIMPLGMRTLIELADDDQIRLIAPGGDVRSGELVFTGDLAEVAFEDNCLNPERARELRQWAATHNLESEAERMERRLRGDGA